MKGELNKRQNNNDGGNTYREGVSRVSSAVVKLQIELVSVPPRELQLDGIHLGVGVEDE